MARTARHLIAAALLLTPAWAWPAVDLAAMTNRYCTECHNTQDWAGGLDLTSHEHGHVGQHAAEWDKIVLKLR
jgi:hypothetical protein